MIPRNPGTLHERQRRDTYTPVWTSSGTAPAIGNGTITGLFSVTNDEVHVVINVVFGSTSTYGTGFWSFSLPFTAAAYTQMLPGYVTDTSVPTFLASMWVVSAGATIAGGGLLTNGIMTASDLMGTGKPYTWATGDAVYIAGTYFAAL